MLGEPDRWRRGHHASWCPLFLYADMRVDLNADCGESFGLYETGDDSALMRSITSASLAAGIHAGDASVLRRTIRLAREHGVAVGAHPGLPDLAGFGRRAMAISPADAEDLVLSQVAAVAGVAAAEGVRIHHVKPHGALYNMAAKDASLAAAIARAVALFDRSLLLFGASGSALLDAGRSCGLRVVAEAFADRAYLASGHLAPRAMDGAVLTDVSTIVDRAIRLVRDGSVETIDGGVLQLSADTLCVHGDTPGAGTIASALREGLGTAGVDVRQVPF